MYSCIRCSVLAVVCDLKIAMEQVGRHKRNRIQRADRQLAPADMPSERRAQPVNAATTATLSGSDVPRKRCGRRKAMCIDTGAPLAVVLKHGRQYRQVKVQMIPSPEEDSTWKVNRFLLARSAGGMYADIQSFRDSLRDLIRRGDELKPAHLQLARPLLQWLDEPARSWAVVEADTRSGQCIVGQAIFVVGPAETSGDDSACARCASSGKDCVVEIVNRVPDGRLLTRPIVVNK